MTHLTHTVVDLPYTASAIYDAFTQQALVTQWLTPHARVALDQGLFELWGPALPEAPAAAATSLLEAVPDRSLRFAWRVRGGTGTVTLTLSELATAQPVPATRVRIECELSPFRAGVADAHDYWCVALENLRRLLARHTTVVFPDFSPRPEGGASVSIDIDAPPAAVFDALVNPAQLDRYIATRAQVDLRRGGAYDFGWKGGGPLKVLDVEPNHRLQYSWFYEHANERMPETVVTWTLEGSNGRTRLTVVHSGFAPKRPSDDYRTGWMRYLHAIKSMLELGDTVTRSELEGVDY